MKEIKGIGIFLIIAGCVAVGARKCYEVYMYKRQLFEIVYILEKIKTFIFCENSEAKEIFLKLSEVPRKDISAFASKVKLSLEENNYRDKMEKNLCESFPFLDNEDKKYLCEYLTFAFKNDRTTELNKLDNAIKYYKASLDICNREYKNKIKVNISLSVFVGMIMAIIII